MRQRTERLWASSLVPCPFSVRTVMYKGVKEKLGKLKLKTTKSLEEIKGDIEKVKTAMKETMSLSDEEINTIINTEVSKRSDSGFGEEVILDAVVRHLRAKLRGEQLSDAPRFDGFLFGDRGPRDRTAQMRMDAIKEYRRDANAALSNNLVTMMDQHGNPLNEPVALDTRETNNWGRANPYFGKPLRSEWTRWFWGVAAQRPDGEAKIFRWNVNGPVATGKHGDPVLFQPMTFRANIRSDGEELYLRHSNVTRFKRSTKLPNVEEILENPLMDNIAFKLSELEQAAAATKDWDGVMITVVDVLNIGEPNERGSIRLTVTDDSLEDGMRTVWVPEHLHYLLNFGRGSKVIVTGNARSNTYNDEVRYQINADGLYALPAYITGKGSVLEEE